jgi:BTB/POZ domain-containing protein 9
MRFCFSAYSYYIEVSVDNITWTRIIDYRNYLCRSWQKLYFPPIVATFVSNKIEFFFQ